MKCHLKNKIAKKRGIILAPQRRKQQKQRRVKVREMVDAGMAKTKIAKELGVNLNTIYRDLQAKEGESDA